MKQALKYAEDLALIYQQEKSKRVALNLANLKMRAVSNSISEGMLVTDQDFQISEANQAAASLLDHSPLEMKGKSILKFLHELRTPLNGIIGLSDLLSGEFESIGDKDIVEMIEGIKESGDRMLKTVEELLTFAQIQSGPSDFSMEDIRVEEMMTDIFASLRTESEERQISMEFESRTDHPLLTGNSSMMYDLFFHVLQNAVNFGVDGGKVQVFCGGLILDDQVWVKLDLWALFQKFPAYINQAR